MIYLLVCSSCGRLKKFNVHLCQKLPFVLACFQTSAAPRPENSDSDEKDTLFSLDPQITILMLYYRVITSELVHCGKFAINNNEILIVCSRLVSTVNCTLETRYYKDSIWSKKFRSNFTKLTLSERSSSSR
jgi:hypothetical protein